MTSPNPVRSLARTPKPRLRHLRGNSHCPRLSVAPPRGCGRRQWRWEIQRAAANSPPPPRSPACGCAQTLPDHDLNFVALADRSVLGTPLCAIFAAKLLLAAHYLMSFIPDGRSIHAVGGSLEASASQGYRVERSILLDYVASAVLATIAGVVIASEINSGSPVLGTDAPVYAIAAVLLGGISMRGGSGSLISMILGVVILGVLTNGLNVSGVGGFYQIIVVDALFGPYRDP
jgi:predicted ABC-type sugar transport system permease subunit